ncbi:sigma-70 family RNA polymerase sigma factor [Bacteroides sp. AN502(2024)]|uniref:sigma-70 family RNA polymerase sigma factor n=1 Tax=Bacteroides sp. AN502(2024) TaxID=3160599 RepID=UPI0035134392
MKQKKLIELCKKGDKQALSWLYQTYADKMIKICFHYVTDRQIAQDLLHDGFIIIFTSINSLRSPEKLEYWMGTIMKNISLRYLKQCSSISTTPLEEMSEDEEPIDTFPSNDFPAYKIMLKMIESLPEGYNKVFKLAVLEGLSHKEIGLLLNIAPHSSSSQLSRAKDLLRKLISQYYTMIGLVILSSIIFIQIWLYTYKKNITAEHCITTTQNEKKQKNEDLLPKDSIKTISNHAITIPQYADSKSIRKIPKQMIILQDSVAEGQDSIKLFNQQIIENQETKERKESYSTYTPQQPSNDKRNWSLALSYSGGEKRINSHQSRIPSDISSGHSKEVLEESHHHSPITLSLSLRKNINEYWGIETGIQYTYLRSDFTVISDSYLEKTCKINYIGIPIKGSFNIWKKQKFSLYTSAGTTLDIPIRATSEELTSKNGQIIFQKKSSLYPHLQWSADFGIGIQYHITPSIGIYAEPNLRYYFHNGDRLNTIRSAKPFNVTLPIGIRLSW